VREKICDKNKVKYLGNGIDLGQFNSPIASDCDIAQTKRELGVPVDAPVVGFVGRLAARRKGFLDFLRAGQIIASRVANVAFIIVGAADLGKEDAVEPVVAQDYGIQDRCFFLGHRPNDELPRLYQLMNVLVLPSLFEGVPRVVMEAAAMRVPAVVTDVKGNREAVEHGYNGLLVPLGDVNALADAIVELLTDREKAHQMGENGRRMALERFDERLVFEKVKAEYARLLLDKGLALPEPELELTPVE